MRYTTAFVACLIIGCVTLPVAAQPVTNPRLVTFAPSPDHATVTGYEWGTFAIGAAAPIQSVTMTKTQLATAGTDYSFPFPRLLFGTFEQKLRACAPSGTTPPVTVCGTWADADKQVQVLPLAPGAVRVTP